MRSTGWTRAGSLTAGRTTFASATLTCHPTPWLTASLRHSTCLGLAVQLPDPGMLSGTFRNSSGGNSKMRFPASWLPMLLLPLVLSRVALAQATPRAVAPDWDALQREAVTLLSEYIRINTTNPPGNELAGARFLKRILDREGIE